MCCVALAAGLALGCEGMMTSVVLLAPSPSGAAVAEVRSRPSLDPPAQSLWLRTGQDGDAHRLAVLGEDVDWCDEIVWSCDGRVVGFLIRGVRLELFDSGSGRHLSTLQLVADDGYPGSREARDVAFSADGTSIEFRECLREQEDECAPRSVASGLE